MEDKELMIGLLIIERVLKRVKLDLNNKDYASAKSFVEIAHKAACLMRLSARLKPEEEIPLGHHEEEESKGKGKCKAQKENILFKKF